LSLNAEIIKLNLVNCKRKQGDEKFFKDLALLVLAEDTLLAGMRIIFHITMFLYF